MQSVFLRLSISKLYRVRSTLHLENSVYAVQTAMKFENKILPHNGHQRINNGLNRITKHLRFQITLYSCKEILWRKELKSVWLVAWREEKA